MSDPQPRQPRANGGEHGMVRPHKGLTSWWVIFGTMLCFPPLSSVLLGLKAWDAIRFDQRRHREHMASHDPLAQSARQLEAERAEQVRLLGRQREEAAAAQAQQVFTGAYEDLQRAIVAFGDGRAADPDGRVAVPRDGHHGAVL